MKVLSIKQPWAGLIVSGMKDMENRSWPTQYRGPLLIHASRAPEPGAAEWLKDTSASGGAYLMDGRPFPKECFPLGAVIGMVELTDCRLYSQSDLIIGNVRDMYSPWHYPGAQGFYFANPIAFETPVPMRGQLSIFELPFAVEHLVSMQIAKAQAAPRRTA